ncbi:MAG: 23S rRNA (uracil(1939)-C(5))-methyltransferase RlmD [Clostridia bacterium]|nr:23S rRNA (uracil(1939)-C(5))-methyltransferase RlmD [Clostridia bacterium]
MNKNEYVDLEIIDNGSSFEGIAKKDGKVVFVPGAIIGEKVLTKVIKITKDYAIASLEEIYHKSVYRTEPICDAFKKCGGCSSEHIEYNMQLLLKNKMVENVLKKQKVTYPNIESTIGMGMPYYYRNKVQYPIRVDRLGNTVMGFYAKRSHDIVQNSCCFIQNRVIDILSKNIFDLLLNEGFVGYNEEKGDGDIRHLLVRRSYHTGEIMLVIIVNNESLLSDRRFEKITKRLIEQNESIKGIFLNLNDSNTNEILGEQIVKLYGEDYITDSIGDYTYYISPKSFFQVNTIQAEVLYTVLKNRLNLQGNEILFDLYSGVGSIGIFLSDKVKEIYGIEIEEEAVTMANKNIELNHVENAEYIAGSVEDKIEEFKQRKIHPDVIVVDPPRRGLDEKSIAYILDFKPQKIGYVSCNPATLARDLKVLEEQYDIHSITPVDLFPHTAHVECVAVLGKK